MAPRARSDDDSAGESLAVIDLSTDDAVTTRTRRETPAAPGQRPGAGSRPARRRMPWIIAAAVVAAVVGATVVQHATSTSHPRPPSSDASTTQVPPDRAVAGPVFDGVAPTHGTLVVGGAYGLRRVDLATGHITAWTPRGLPADGITLRATDGRVTVVSTQHTHSLFEINGTDDSARAAAIASDGAFPFVGPDGTVWLGSPNLAEELDGARRHVTLAGFVPYGAVTAGFIADVSEGASHGLVLIDPSGRRVLRTLTPPSSELVAAHPDRIAWSDGDCQLPTCFVHVLDITTGRDEVVASVSQPQGFASGAFSADGRRLAIRDAANIDLIDLETGRTVVIDAGTSVVGVRTLAFSGQSVVSVAGANGVLATTGIATAHSAVVFADRGDLALWPVERWRSPAPRLASFSLPTLFGPVTGLRALGGEHMVDVDTGVVTASNGSDAQLPVPLANGELFLPGAATPNEPVEFVDPAGHVTKLGPATSVLGGDGAHAWLERRATSGEYDYYPVDPGTRRLGTPAHSFVPAVGAAGASLVFQEERIDTPPVLVLVDGAGGRRQITLPGGNMVTTMNDSYIVSVTPYGCGPCVMSVTSIATGETHPLTTVNATYQGGVLLAPTGSRALVSSITTAYVVDLATDRRIGAPFTTNATDPSATVGIVGGWSTDGWLLALDRDGSTLMSPTGVRTHASLSLTFGPFVLVHAK